MIISNVRSKGKTFTSLKYELIKYYKEEMARNSRIIHVAKIGLTVCLFILAYYGIKKIYSYFTYWGYSRKYPRVEEV